MVVPDPEATTVWHSGGKGRSYGQIARDPAGETFVFWATNQARGDDRNPEEGGVRITEGVLERVARAGPVACAACTCGAIHPSSRTTSVGRS